MVQLGSNRKEEEKTHFLRLGSPVDLPAQRTEDVYVLLDSVAQLLLTLRVELFGGDGRGRARATERRGVHRPARTRRYQQKKLQKTDF